MEAVGSVERVILAPHTSRAKGNPTPRRLRLCTLYQPTDNGNNETGHPRLYDGSDCAFALADALEEASQSKLAEHFRPEGWHPKGCWAVDLILGRE